MAIELPTVSQAMSRQSGGRRCHGYLAAGVVIGPWGFGVITDVENILHLGEFGVVLLLFVIGLEMQPRRLWLLRRSIMVLGGLQVLLIARDLGPSGTMVGSLSMGSCGDRQGGHGGCGAGASHL